jgi:hypothetical protein
MGVAIGSMIDQKMRKNPAPELLCRVKCAQRALKATWPRPVRATNPLHGKLHQLGEKIQSVMPHNYKRDAARRVPGRDSQ